MKNGQKGQVLILTVMLLATVITVVMTVSYKSTIETQVTKLEEEAQKALAAAEAGIEVALQQGSGTVVLGSGGLNLPGFTGQATVSTTYSSTKFVTKSLVANEAYTFYLADYDRDTNTFSSYWSGQLGFYVKSAGSGCPAVEIIRIKSDNTIEKYLIDPCNYFSDKVSGNGELSTPTPTPTSGTLVVDGVTYTFDYKTSSTALSISADTKMLVMRTLVNGTKIGVEGTTTLRAQGKTVVSEAVSATGVTKKIQLLQSHPQFPADFFVTRF